MWVGEDLCSACLVGAPALDPAALVDPIGLEIPGLVLAVVSNVLARALASGELETEAHQLIADTVGAFDALLVDNDILDADGMAQLLAKRDAAAPRVIVASR